MEDNNVNEDIPVKQKISKNENNNINGGEAFLGL